MPHPRKTFEKIEKLLEKDPPCQHKNIKVVGSWSDGRQPDFPMLVRECQDCGAIHLGNGPNYYESWDGKPHWGKRNHLS